MLTTDFTCTIWRRSSHSGNGGACVEVGVADTQNQAWRKSSHSGNGGECVEAAVLNEAVGVRDSKDPHGPILVLDRQRWTGLLAALKTVS